jgi:hypothetical protein
LVKSILLSINSKIIALSLILSLAALITVSILSFIAANNLLKERVEDQLISESTGRGTAIRSLIETRIQQIRLLGTNGIIQNIIFQLYQNKTADSNTVLPIYQKDFQTEIESFQKVLGKSAILENVKVIGVNGRVLISTDPSDVGKNYSDHLELRRGVTEPFVYFDLKDNERKTIVTVPVLRIDNNETSNPVGVIVATMDSRAFDEILLNRKGLGQTGEVYLVNEDKKMISESRFIENAAFRQTVDTLPVKECFEKDKEINTIYNDYRNIPIVGFSYCAKDLGLVLLAEIDEAEIFKPIAQLKNQIIVISIIISSILVAIAVYV